MWAKNTSGLTRHEVKCPVLSGQGRRMLPREDESISLDRELMNKDHVSPVGFSEHDSPPFIFKGGDESNMVYGFERADEEEDGLDNDRPFESVGVVSGTGFLSSSGSIRVEQYKDVTGYDAGKPLDLSEVVDMDDSSSDDEERKAKPLAISISGIFRLIRLYQRIFEYGMDEKEFKGRLLKRCWKSLLLSVSDLFYFVDAVLWVKSRCR